MKLRIILISFALAVSNLSWSAPDAKEHKPLYGGQLVVVKDIDYELVVNSTTLVLYIRDHGKPVDISKAMANLTLLTGSERQEIELKPNGEKLEATGSFKVGAGTKVVAIIINNGKQSTVRLVMQ